MKTGKTLRRLAAAVLAGTMMLAMSTSAFAAQQQAPTSVQITKKITKGEYDYAPATDFIFTIASGTSVDGSAGQSNIKEGPAGGLTFNDGAMRATLTSSPKSSDIKQTTITVGTADLKVDTTKFVDDAGNKEYGIYRYTVTETNSGYEGITYDTVVRTVDVYYTNENGVDTVTFAVTNGNGNPGKGTLEFINAYEVKDVTITKEVTGNQGSNTKEFEFTFKVDGDNNENYYVIITRKNGTADDATLVSKAAATTISLKAGESVKIHGLSASDQYTVTETSYASEGYTTTIDGVATSTKTASITQDTNVQVINNKSATTPTGIITNVLPYVLMVAAAAALVFVFLRKREYDR